MEIGVDLNDPYKSIKKYLDKNFIGISRQEELQNNYHSKKSSEYEINHQYNYSKLNFL